jgi:hypothetical protein
MQKIALIFISLSVSLAIFGQIPVRPQPPRPATFGVPQPTVPTGVRPHTAPSFHHNSPTFRVEQHKAASHARQQEQQAMREEIHRQTQLLMSRRVNYDFPSCVFGSEADFYRNAFDKLSSMAEDDSFDLSKAIFTVENAFFDNAMNFEAFDRVIKHISGFLSTKMDELEYDRQSNSAKNLMLFQFFADTLTRSLTNEVFYPIEYDFGDPFGNDYSNTFVTKLLATNTGQCYSMPMLYLILAEEIGAKAHLVYAPNHAYIKFQRDDGRWQNVELTSHVFSSDAFVLSSGKISANAIQNKTYMHPFSQRQLLADMFVSLTQGYIRKYCYDEFAEQIIDKALELDPTNIVALSTKSNFVTLRFEHVARQLGMTQENIYDVLAQHPRANALALERNRMYDKLDYLGYTEMAVEEYMEWLESSKAERAIQELMRNSLQIRTGTERRGYEKTLSFYICNIFCLIF